MPYVSRDKNGQKPPAMGRPAGKPNKATQNAREAIARFVDGNAHRLVGWLDRIAKDSPKQAFDCFMAVCEYHVPKLQRTEVDMLVKNDLAELPTSTINVLINSLRLSLEQETLTASNPLAARAVAVYEAASLPVASLPALPGCEADSISAELSDLLPSEEKYSSEGVGGGHPPLIGEARYPLSPKNEGHTDDRITADRTSESETTAKNFSGALPSRKTEAVIRSGAKEEAEKIRDISALL